MTKGRRQNRKESVGFWGGGGFENILFSTSFIEFVGNDLICPEINRIFCIFSHFAWGQPIVVNSTHFLFYLDVLPKNNCTRAGIYKNVIIKANVTSNTSSLQ